MRRAEVLAALMLAAASVAAAWLVPRPMPPEVALAIPLVWGGLFVYVPFRAAAWWAWREVVRAAPRPEDRQALGFVFLLAFGLLIWGLDWGLTDASWAVDELRPDWVRGLIHQGLGGGWHDKYPWLHYAVLALPVSAFDLADRAGILPAAGVASWAGQLALMRGVSVLMALGTLVAAYLCGTEMVGPRRAPLAPLALLLTPLFLYYGKMANLDMPALCWFAWAMVAFLRIRRANRLRDYVWLGLAAAGSVATKDQAYANLGLVAVAALAINAGHHAAPARWWNGLGRAIADRRIWAAGTAAIAASAIFHNVLFNAAGAVAHFRLLATLGDLAIVPPTAGGYLELTGLTAALFRWSLGWPLFVLAAAGVAGACARPDRRWQLWLLVVPVSFHLLFTCVTRYVNDRYLFGGVFVLALFAGAACADAFDAGRRRAGRLAVAASLTYALLYASSINVMMSLDARRAVKAWVAEATDGRSVVGLVGRSYMPRIAGPARAVRVEPSIEAVRQASPDLLLLNARFAARFEQAREPEGRALLRALEDESLGYREVFRYRAPIPGWAVLQYELPLRGAAESTWTNLDKVNPEMVVYRRLGGRP